MPCLNKTDEWTSNQVSPLFYLITAVQKKKYSLVVKLDGFNKKVTFQRERPMTHKTFITGPYARCCQMKAKQLICEHNIKPVTGSFPAPTKPKSWITHAVSGTSEILANWQVANKRTKQQMCHRNFDSIGKRDVLANKNCTTGQMWYKNFVTDVWLVDGCERFSVRCHMLVSHTDKKKRS